ncbi:hypothetical protein GCK72_017072 [Caenorhabditis remanei]|uniref:Uncharacterized protein n=1 Tax=Caenorhabditis remanei TaxID=31234 RepID=A0A6A5G749_CAERE|nr:hypothetical protein GCK72_017072 [Caenorhabditis remanei]KAF1750522.1 hypothetical protein GCK72_017072 [Caenorhabditis remanei]
MIGYLGNLLHFSPRPVYFCNEGCPLGVLALTEVFTTNQASLGCISENKRNAIEEVLQINDFITVPTFFVLVVEETKRFSPIEHFSGFKDGGKQEKATSSSCTSVRIVVESRNTSLPSLSSNGLTTQHRETMTRFPKSSSGQPVRGYAKRIDVHTQGCKTQGHLNALRLTAAGTVPKKDLAECQVQV